MNVHPSVWYQIASRNLRAAAHLSQVSRNIKEGMRDRLQRAPVTARTLARRWKVKARFSRYTRSASTIMKMAVRALDVFDLEYDKYRSKPELALKMARRELERVLQKKGFHIKKTTLIKLFIGGRTTYRGELRVTIQTPQFQRPRLNFVFANDDWSIRFDERTAPAITYRPGIEESEEPIQMVEKLTQEWKAVFSDGAFQTRQRIAREAARTVKTPAVKKTSAVKKTPAAKKPPGPKPPTRAWK